jgi:Ca-activated chloride channel family protein
MMKILLMLQLIFAALLNAQLPEKENLDKTLSPYFFVKSDDPNLDKLPLKSTGAEVNIVGVIADVRVMQVYQNEGKKPLEAIYIFPASTRAAVYSMKMTIGDRTIVAKIEKKEEARQHYEEAKAAGKSASLLEQQRPNVFQMNVANIMPGDVIKVEMSYTESLTPTEKVYEFVYPTVVGPRYSNQPSESAPASEKWVENPYLHEGEKAPYTFDISVNISGGMPIQSITCPSHKINIQYENKSLAMIKLDNSESEGGNRDYILKYRLAGDKIQDGLLLYQGEKENFFLLMMQPPERVKTEQIPPREYIFIVDVSGSMNGFPLDISKKLLRNLIGNLRDIDQFNVLLFASSSTVMAEHSLPANEKNIERAIRVIDEQQGGGGTELLPALKRALDLPRVEGVSRSVLIITDGYVSVETEAFDLIKNNLNKSNMFAFGIGTGVNRYIIEGMARVGMGESFVIEQSGGAEIKAEQFRQYIASPVLTQIKVDFDQFETYDVEPVSLPDILAERPVTLFGKWRGKAKGTISLKGYTGGQKAYRSTLNIADYKPDINNGALKYLWARHRIALLGDYNLLRESDERIKEITQLGLDYNLLTNYTSFVAIDSEIRNKDGESTTVKQPLPLPQGVSEFAVGSMGMLKRVGAGRGGKAYQTVALPAAPIESEDDLLLAEPAVERKLETGIFLDTVTVDPKSEHERIKQFITGKLVDLQTCIVNFTMPSAEITVAIETDNSGKVTSVKIIKTNFTNSPVLQCIINQIKKWQFQKGKAKITCTFGIRT